MSDRSTVVLVHAVMVVLAAADAWFISRFGSGIPIQDEWDILSGWLASDSTWSWLFAHHNEHRYPLAKLLWLGELRLVGFAFKPLLFVPLALMIGAALMILRAARTIRGRQLTSDAFLPALLLHWGHWFNWLMSYQLGFAIVAWAAAGWLWTAAQWDATGAKRWAALSLGFAVAIVPCGGFGLLFTPCVVGWCGWLAWRSTGGLRTGGVIAAIGVIAYTGFVAGTMPPPSAEATRVSPLAAPGEFGSAAGGFLSVAAGAWQAKEPLAIRIAVAAAVVGVYGFAVWRMLRSRSRAAAVAGFAILAGTILIAAATAFARGTGLMDRMAVISAAGLCTAWIWATTATGPPRVLVLAIAVALVAVNISEPMAYARNLRHTAYRVERDLREQRPPLLIAGQYGRSFPVAVGDSLADTLRQLKAAGIVPYSNLPDDPPFRTQPITELPAKLTPGETTLPLAPPAAFALRLHVVSERVVHHDTVRLIGTGPDAEAWLAPPVARSSLVLPIADPAGALRLVIGPGIESLRIESAEFLLRPE